MFKNYVQYVEVRRDIHGNLKLYYLKQKKRKNIENTNKQNTFDTWLLKYPQLVENMLSGLVDWKQHTSEFKYEKEFEKYKEKIKNT